MNYRGKVLTKYYETTTQKHDQRQLHRNDSISYEHGERMQRLFTLALFLALRNRIEDAAKSEYMSGKTDAIVSKIMDPIYSGDYMRDLFCSDSASVLVWDCDMGFEPVEPDFCVDIYVLDIEKLILDHTQKVWNSIGNESLSIFHESN